ncbi:phospholipase C, phosphocholine-specific [soil metagenome]
MPNRRQFLRYSAAMTGAGLIESIQKAFAIEAEPGTSVYDAEHVVILMQENRSFDHTFGTLKGVRGFNDPRAIRLEDGNSAFVQANAAKEHFVPFRLDIKNTKTTWMGSLPHGRSDQVAAANGGKHDRWLTAKKPGKAYSTMPLTMGYHTREDIPFYYALADAFTVCDQNFCSTLTGTTPNRLHLWTGTIRETMNAASTPLVLNEQCDYGKWQKWTTFPERLEDLGVSWKIYQNELTVPNGLAGDAESWLSNYGDSPLEWFTQYGVRFAASHRKFLDGKIQAIPEEIAALNTQVSKLKGDAASKMQKKIVDLKTTLARDILDRAEFSPEKFDKLPTKLKSLHHRAFVTNVNDPAYRELTTLTYKDGDATRSVKVPKGDVLHQFRKDVDGGTLPTVSWLVAPERFSDHPSSAWYGQWYLSEVLNILTKKPDVWKKTVFILTYDENDGYFDHIPPFQAPHPKKPETGIVTQGIDTGVEYEETAKGGNALGLGFRVPMVIASPWSRGGCVCSEVFDHTSVIRFLETLLTQKTGKLLVEPNITKWRRTICGNLMSAFQTTADTTPGLKDYVNRDEFVESIHKAQFRKLPDGFHALTPKELEQAGKNPRESQIPWQEPGTKRSAPLPYELLADGALNNERNRFIIKLEARRDLFGANATGAPFIIYAFTSKGLDVRNYTVAAGEHLEDSWPLDAFDKGQYHVRIHGPNGFYREFRGNANDPAVSLKWAATPGKSGERTGGVQIIAEVHDAGKQYGVHIRDQAYGHAEVLGTLSAGKPHVFEIVTPKSGGWYDVSVTSQGVSGFKKRYAGRVETGRWSITDPAMA